MFIDVLKYPKIHYFFSGSPQDPHAGVGFAVPALLLPIVYDFHPWNSRPAVLLLNIRPLRVALFTVYAPSFIQDSTADGQDSTA
jgi:hypothetical protein